MTKALVASRDGQAFQARHFWLKALNLFDANSPIAKVGFEGGPRGFDDMWVEYKPGRGPNGAASNQISKIHYQCKWHVLQGEYGYADLVDPGFINASSLSLLKRARNAQVAQSADRSGLQFTLLTNWHIKKDDPLCRLVQQRNGTIRLNSLFDGTGTDSLMGKIRKLWSDHLEINENELRQLASTLAFANDSGLLTSLREALDNRMEAAGLRIAPLQQDSCWYDDLVYQWLANGRTEFDGESLRAACTAQGLFEKKAVSAVMFGVKSFEHPVDRLEDRCTEVLDLTPYFADRRIRVDADWAQVVYPRLKNFLLDAAKKSTRLKLVFDAHLSLAFAAGSVLNIKAGRRFELEQRILDPVTWHADDSTPAPDWPGFDFEWVPGDPQNHQMAVAVSVTREVSNDVRAHMAAHLPGCSLLTASLTSGPGNTVIKSGRHAFDLAADLARHIVQRRSREWPVHLFISGPNVFSFFVGQQQPYIGSLTLYEFDLEGLHGGKYSASLSLPVQTVA